MPITIDLTPAMDARIDALVIRTGRDRATLVHMLLESGIEDLEDAAAADEIWERVLRGEERICTAAEMRAELGLED